MKCLDHRDSVLWYYLNMDIQIVSEALGQPSGVSSPHQNMEESLFQCMYANSFWCIAPKHVDIGPSDFIFGDSTCSCNWKCRHFTNTFFMPLNHLQPPQDLWKGVAAHDQMCLCVHSFRWRLFWVFSVNCDLNNNKSPTWECVLQMNCFVASKISQS
jgi:hypothetical protein